MKKKSKEVKKQFTKIASKNNLKSLIIIISVLILALLLFIIINKTTGRVIDPSNSEDPLGIGLNPNAIPQTPEDAAQVSKDYLRKEWVSILNNTNNPVGKALWAAHRGMTFMSPVFKIVIGLEYSFSWLFALTLVIWITLIVFFYRIFSVFSTFSKGASLGISLCVMIIGSVMKIPLWTANKIIDTINLLTSWQMRLAMIITLVIGLILISMFSKQWAGLMKKWKENRQKMKMMVEIENLKSQGKSQAEIQKIIVDMFGEIAKD